MLRRVSVVMCVVLLVVACSPATATLPTAMPLVPTAAPTSLPPTVVRPTATPRPITQASHPTSAPTSNNATSNDDELAALAAAVPATRDQTVLAEQFKNTGDLPDVVRTTPLQVVVGDVEQFWVADVADNSHYQVDAQLRYAGPIVLMYVDTSISGDIDQSELEAAARTFEQQIYPRNRAIFGNELSPGIDGDPRLTVLNTNVRGAGGYFSSADGVVKAVNRFSNERDMFVIGVDSYPIGTPGYESTLAHEFQHMIEWNVVRRSPSWFNEGMSTIAEDVNGYGENGQPLQHLAEPDLQLTTWATPNVAVGRHYGASRLFLRYIHEQYGGDATLGELIKADAGNNTTAFVDLARRTHGDVDSFDDLVADWAVANLVNNTAIGDGRFAYARLPTTVVPHVVATSAITNVAQFGADYFALPSGPAALRFDGADSVLLTGALPVEGRYAWWSNSGDDSQQTLTRAFDLRGVPKATLQFSLWYEIERDYDYGYVAVSTDNGTIWQTLKGAGTTTSDPQGANLGNGFTGASGLPEQETEPDQRGQWTEEQMDLTPFAGQQILLRFTLVSDVALNRPGMLIDNIRIPQLGYADGGEQGDTGWQATGFVRTDGELRQQWVLRLVRETAAGTTVEAVPTDPQGRAGIVLGEGERGTLMIMAATPFTTERAEYQYQVERR